MGGKRPGAGRKPGIPNLIKKSLQQKITDRDVVLALNTLRAAMESDNWRARVGAATYLLDQKFGKARQNVELSNPEGQSFRLIFDYGESTN